MFERRLQLSEKSSSFLFGPRGTGKSSLLSRRYPSSIYIDLLESEIFRTLLAKPERLEELIGDKSKEFVVIDEIQRVPALLNEVHRLIENQDRKFILTGSNARKLRKTQANLLAGRALKNNLYPLTVAEIGPRIDIEFILRWGLLPTLHDENKGVVPKDYLESYVQVYLEEEIMQEGLTRNLSSFSRFLEVASFSQAQQVNVSAVARECAINRKVAESYFSILYDLLIAYSLPVFKKRAKRNLVSQNKFYFFDIGVYSAIKPKGFLDRRENEEGVLYESLVLQELIATNDYLGTGYEVSYWRTKSGVEVDFILYGEENLIAFEVKRKPTVERSDVKSLLSFKSDYEMAELYLLYGGEKRLLINGVKVLPVKDALLNLSALLKGSFEF